MCKRLVAGMIVCLIWTSMLGAATVLDEAKIYFPFEGEDTGIDGECWKNKGSAGYDEGPVDIGSAGTHVPTVTANGLKGQAYDGSMMLFKTTENAYRWGNTDPNLPDTALEDALKNTKSFTITWWIYTDQPYDQGRIAACPSFIINRRYDYLETTLDNKTDPVLWWLKSLTAWDDRGLRGYPAVEHWRYCAIVYDGTGDANNLMYYGGGITDSTLFHTAVEANLGALAPDPNIGAPLTIGNANPESDRPFVGLIDELRIWTSQSDSSGALSPDDLEFVRRWDAGLCRSELMTGDFNQDCFVDLADLSLLSENYLKTNPTP